MGGICSQNSKTAQLQNDTNTLETQPDQYDEFGNLISFKPDVTSLITKPEDMPGIITKKHKRQMQNAENPYSQRKYSDMHKTHSRVSSKQFYNSRIEQQAPNINNDQIDNLINDLQQECRSQINNQSIIHHDFIIQDQSVDNKLIPDIEDDNFSSQSSIDQQNSQIYHNNDINIQYELQLEDYPYTNNSQINNQMDEEIISLQQLQSQLIDEDQYQQQQQSQNNSNFLQDTNDNNQLENDYKLSLKNDSNDNIINDDIIVQNNSQIIDQNDDMNIVQDQQLQYITSDIIIQNNNSLKQDDDASNNHDNDNDDEQIQNKSQDLKINNGNNQQQVNDDEEQQLQNNDFEVQTHQDTQNIQEEVLQQIIETDINEILENQDDQIIEQQTPQQQQIISHKEYEDIYEQNKQIYLEQELYFNEQITQQLIEQYELEQQEQIRQKLQQEELQQMTQEEQLQINYKQECIYNQRLLNEVIDYYHEDIIETIIKEQMNIIIQESNNELQKEHDEMIRLKEEEETKQKLEEMQLQQVLLTTKQEITVPIINVIEVETNQNLSPQEQDNDIQVDMKDSEEFFRQIDEENKMLEQSQQQNQLSQQQQDTQIDTNFLTPIKVSLIELDDEDKQVDVKMREDEEQLKQAENKLKDYVSKWAVKTIELHLGQQSQPSNQGGGLGDGQSSTYEETNYDEMSEYSETPNSARDNQQQNMSSPSTIILRKKTTKKRFPLKKKKTMSRAGSILEGQTQTN